MAFQPGQALDVQDLNKLADYPKKMLIDQIAGGTSTANMGTGYAPFVNLRGDIIATQVNSTTLRVQPGEYYMEFPFRVHSAGWQYGYIYINGVAVESRAAYCATSSMNTNIVKLRATFTEPTEIRFYFQGTYNYATTATIEMLKEL